MSDKIFHALTHETISYYHHSWAVSPDLFTKHPKLNELLEITALNHDSEGTVFVASTQGRKYPLYSTMYHSEKNAYEWDIPANHSAEAIAITTAHSN
jgi:hypothetical protein